jgi:Tfp pilus assembly protein PilP
MKRTLALSLFIGLTMGALAQTPTVVELPKATAASKPAASAKPAAQNKQSTASKPSPATVKVVPAANQKTATVAPKLVPQSRPNVVAVQTAPKATVTPFAKANTSVKPMVAAVPKTAPAVQVPMNAAHPLVGLAPGQRSPVPAKDARTPFAKNMPVKPVTAAKPPAMAVKSQPVRVKGGTTVSVEDSNTVAEKKPAPHKTDAAGRRDPFVSPVVAMTSTGSGCSSGKRCLAIDDIALKGVVRSDTGMIAVVVNALDKAYFLRENDPVFNGYVEKITGDSIVFKETFHDRLGKELTRDVTKTISRPAV